MPRHSSNRPHGAGDDDATWDSDDPGRASPRRLAAALHEGLVPSDEDFDRHLPIELRAVSGRYFTPLAVARRVAEWLDELGVETTLDIGSGAGKFCVAAALAGRGRFVGLEQRPNLVRAARSLARRFRVEDRVHFVEGALGEVPTPPADAYYLFHPFGENLYARDDCLDVEVELGFARYRRDVAVAEALLRDAPVGTVLVTYNGFGGRIPSTYVDRKLDRELPCVLRAFERVEGEDRGASRILEPHEELAFDDDDRA